MTCPLRPRELEAVKLLADGNSAKEIAIIWGRSPWTVNRIITNALRASDQHKTVSLVAKALREGWIA
jgi:DNA-binding CsgD family transcriptional regulator